MQVLHFHLLIDLIQHHQELSSNRSVGLKRQLGEQSRQGSLGPQRTLLEKRFEFFLGFPFNSNLNVTAAKSDWVAGKLHRGLPAISNPRSLFLEEGVFPMSGEHDEDPAE